MYGKMYKLAKNRMPRFRGSKPLPVSLGTIKNITAITVMKMLGLFLHHHYSSNIFKSDP